MREPTEASEYLAVSRCGCGWDSSEAASLSCQAGDTPQLCGHVFAMFYQSLSDQVFLDLILEKMNLKKYYSNPGQKPKAKITGNTMARRPSNGIFYTTLYG